MSPGTGQRGNERRREARLRIAVVATLVTCAAAAGAAIAVPTPVGSDFRISNTGTDGDPGREAIVPAVAYNSTANEYLVVWEGDGLPTDDEQEIFGQRVSASGVEIGSDFRISNVGTDGDDGRAGHGPAVAYNPTANEYLVTWDGDGLATPNEVEVFGQRVSAAGTELGADFRISNVGPDTDPTRAATRSAVVYNPAANEYLVIWEADGLATNDEVEVFGQRVSAGGAELGTDFRISNTGTDGDQTRDVQSPDLAYSSVVNEYLVVWEADGLATGNELEIFGQRVSALGTELGSDFRISNVGTDGDVDRGAFKPAVAYNSAANEYLVGWHADGLATDNEFEIFGQRVSGAGAEVGSDFRISNVGTDGDATRDGVFPALAYGAFANEYLIAWDANGLPTVGEFEIFGQGVSAAGAELGADFRISMAGSDTDPAREAESAAVAYSSAANEYLVTWEGDGLPTDDEFEIFGHRVAGSAPAPSPAKCAGKTATKTGTSKRDVIRGTNKRDVIAALGGKDTVRSLGGNDIVCGGKGRDKLVGGKGKDLLRGENGADTLKGGAGKDKLKGGKGADKLIGGAGRDKLIGGAGRDKLIGGAGRDTQVQ